MLLWGAACLYFFFMKILDAVRFFSIFFRNWANLVAGLRAGCRPLSLIGSPILVCGRMQGRKVILQVAAIP